MTARTPDVVTVAITRADGGVTVMRVITAEYEPDGEGGRRKRWEVKPTKSYVDGLIAKHVEAGSWTGPLAPVSWRFVDDDYALADRTFRDAWKDEKGKKPTVDMVKARDIHRDRLRDLRAPLLEALDTDYMRADEAGDQQAKKRIAERKQALRDITADPAIEAAKTPDELKAVISEGLD